MSDFNANYARNQMTRSLEGNPETVRVKSSGTGEASKWVDVPASAFIDMVDAMRDDSELKALPRMFMGGSVIAHMRVRHTPGTVLHQAIIICEREPDQESENPDYTVHHIGSDSVAKDWYGVAGVYDIKDIGEAFIEFQRKLTTYDAIPSF